MAGEALLVQGEKRRKEIVAWISKFAKKNGFNPTLDEIAEAVGLSKTAVRHHLATLQKEGKVTHTPGKYRSLRVLK